MDAVDAVSAMVPLRGCGLRQRDVSADGGWRSISSCYHPVRIDRSTAESSGDERGEQLEVTMRERDGVRREASQRKSTASVHLDQCPYRECKVRGATAVFPTI